MLHLIDIVTAAGRPFRVAFIPAVDAGPNKHRHPNDNREATVEIFDRRGHDTDLPGWGQFTGGSYYAGTLLGYNGIGNDPLNENRLVTEGLNVHGGVPEWSIDGETMRLVLTWLQRMVEAERIGQV